MYHPYGASRSERREYQREKKHNNPKGGLTLRYAVRCLVPVVSYGAGVVSFVRHPAPIRPHLLSGFRHRRL